MEGVSKLFTQHPDLIILDVMMPGMNGFEVCERIRQVSDTPLIMLTALNHERNASRLEAGADDFLSKPFNADILLARARTVLRRSENLKSQSDQFNYDNGHLSIDVARRDVLIQNKRIKLTPVEFRLLTYLARNAGKVLTFEQILTNVWGVNIVEAWTMFTYTFRTSEENLARVLKALVTSSPCMALDIYLRSSKWHNGL